MSTFPPNSGPENLWHFWFGDYLSPEQTPANASWWFAPDEKIDSELRERFEPRLHGLDLAAEEEWKQTLKGKIALVLLWDQVPRNLYREDGRAYKYDAQALKLTLSIMGNPQFKSALPYERAFGYMPLMHSESLEVQHLSVEAFSALAQEVPTNLTQNFKMNLEYAEKHRQIIERFGRFPHRNEALGRSSTPEETAFLKEPGSSF